MESRRRRSPSLEDEDGKLRQGQLRERYKRSRHADFDDLSDDERRKHRSKREYDNGAERRLPREDKFLSPDRRDTDDNGKNRYEERRASPRKDSPSPERKSRGSRDRKRHEESRVSHRKDRYSPLSETKDREHDKRRKESHSPPKLRDEKRCYSPSSNRRHRDGNGMDGRRESNSPLRHRHHRDVERSKVSSRKDFHSSSPDRNHRSGGRRAPVERTISDNEEQVFSRNDNRISYGEKLHDGHGDMKLHGEEEDVSVLDRYAGNRDSTFHDRDDRWIPKVGEAKDLSKTTNKYSDDDEGNIRRSRLDGKDHGKKSRNGRDSDRTAKERASAHEGKEPKHMHCNKEALQERAVDASGKGNKSSNNNVPAVNASAEIPVGRSGGVYIPPFKLAQMMKEIQDKSSVEYQRMTWDALRKSINGLVNKVNASNIKNIIPELLSENLIRGRGLFARSCMKSQLASPLFTNVFAALVAVVNTKFPELGELLLKRVILQFRRALKRNDKPLLLAAARFIAHLVNQQVAHEVVALEVLMVLLENPTDDSVEVAVGFIKECGAILQDLAPQGLHGIFERFRGILHEGEIDKRVQFMIEGLFAIRKAGFQGHPAVIPELDLVDPEEQFTHEISLSEDLNGEMSLDIFKPDENFQENEKKYEGIKRDILGEESSDDDDDDDGENGSGLSSEDDDDDDEDEAEMQRMQIKDETETNLVNLRRTIYLTIMSSVDFEEAGHKLLKIKLEPGQEMELNIMLLECCSQERTYLRYYGLLGQRFCMINKIYQENFDECFVKQYSMIHRLETNKLRNVAKFFAHLLGTHALPWNVLGYIKLTEEDTTSSSRIFIKILFQELSEHLGLRKLNEKLNEPGMEECFDGIFPKDNPKNTRFAINFFTSIGLGGITDNLREYLKNMPRLIMQQQRQLESEPGSSESEDTSGTKSSSSGSSSSESESESDSESETESDQDSRRKRKRK